jgi:DNA-binding LacI/PurR family transcriptional regulator
MATLTRIEIAKVAAAAEVDPRTVRAYIAGKLEMRPTTRRAVEEALRSCGFAAHIRPIARAAA